MRFYKFPVKEDRYNEARAWLKRFGTVYEYGTVKNIGLSDLDIIVVGNKHIRKIPLRFRAILEGGSPYAIMDKDSFKEVKLLGNINLRRLHGEDIEVNEPPDEVMLAVAQVMDWLPERILRLQTIVNNEWVNVTDALGFLRSFMYSIEDARKFIPFNQGKVFMDRVHLMRNEWFDLTEKRQINDLMMLLNEGIDIGKFYMDKVSQAVVYAKYYPEFDGDGCFHINKDIGYDFGGDEIPGSWISVPSVWAVHLQWLSLFGGRVGKIIERNLSCEVSPLPPNDLEYFEFLGKRMELCNKIYHVRGSYRFGHLEAV